MSPVHLTFPYVKDAGGTLHRRIGGFPGREVGNDIGIMNTLDFDY